MFSKLYSEDKQKGSDRLTINVKDYLFHPLPLVLLSLGVYVGW